MLVGHLRLEFALLAQRERVGQVFLDRDRRAFPVVREVDDGEAAQRKLPFDPVLVQLETGGKWAVRLRRHLEEGWDPAFRD